MSQEASAHRERGRSVFLCYFNPSFFNSLFVFAYKQESLEPVWCHLYQSSGIDREEECQIQLDLLA